MSEPKRRPMPPARPALHPPQRPVRQVATAGPVAEAGSSSAMWVAAGVVLALVGALCLVVVGLLGLHFLGSGSTGDEVEISQNETEIDQALPDDSTPASDEEELPVEVDPVPVIPDPILVEPEPEVQPPLPAEAPSEPPPADRNQPLDDVRQRNLRLVLPAQEVPAAMELAKVYVDSPAECELKLLGAECFASAEGTYRLELKDVDSTRRDWKLLLKPAAGVGSGSPIGTFTLQQQSLSFAWQPIKGNPRSFAFQFCLLQIKVGDQKLSCRLAEPVEAALPPFSIAGGRGSVKIPFPQLMLCDPAHLRLKLSVPQFAGQPFVPGDTLKLGEKIKLKIANSGVPGAAGEAPVELEFQFNKRNTEPELTVGCWADVPRYEISLPMPAKEAKVELKTKHKLADLKGAATAPKKILDEIIKPRAGAEKQKPVAEARVANAQQAALNSPNNFGLQQAWQFESMNLARINNFLAGLRAAEDAANAWLTWIEAMQALQTSLSGETGVQIELFVEIEGEAVTLYRSQAAGIVPPRERGLD